MSESRVREGVLPFHFLLGQPASRFPSPSTIFLLVTRLRGFLVATDFYFLADFDHTCTSSGAFFRIQGQIESMLPYVGGDEKAKADS